MFIEIVILLILLAVLLDYLNKKRRNDLTANLSGPKAYPLIGGLLHLLNRTPANLLEMSLINREKYGSLYKIWLFNKLLIFGTDPRDIEMVLSSSKLIEKSTLYDILQVWLGTGLLLSTGSKWHSRRKIITPAFHFNILEHFIEVFDQQTEILVQRLKEKCDKDPEPFNIQPYICLAALDIITETSMGTKVHAQTDSNNNYVKGISEILKIMVIRFVHPFLRDDIILSLFRNDLKKDQDKTIDILHNFTENVIKKRRKELEESLNNGNFKQDTSEDNYYGNKKRMALLDVLLQSTIKGEPLTNSDIREEVDTFMFEGHDTTTSAICSAIYEISRHPNVQEKIIEEIKSVIGTDTSKPVGYRELTDMKYLECVIKETLRLYPPVPMIGRKINEDVNLPSGRIIPAGTNFTINIYAAHRDESRFPNAKKFIPERHEDNLIDSGDAFTFVPFSAGPRNCIGQKFAMLEMKSTLSKLLRHYELLPLGPDMKVISNLVLRSGNGVHIGIKKRIF
ncbi:cytochrome P450 4d2-like [Condylostylus longicornis]|uniref:cytochrome P450 4d2-like n=1 Tax=Condylostylus longicornis TaxID=2530218 RepID=UPI00244DC597|nr:cytochrome P450 4d2-like [Condylostylus longicornis]